MNRLVDIADLDDTLNKAFLLASFIHGSKETALRVVTEAAARLEVAASAQGKRLYYRPVGRAPRHQSKTDGPRNKVSFSELHLLQRLIYIESETYERQKEQAGGGDAISAEDMLTHFIKHLVRITIKRNSFYVTLGLSRLLYNYATSETMEIFNVVIQDPERVKDDYYYRSRKGVLMQELKERFGELVRICRGQHGEERFQAEPQPGRFAGLVRECLSAFTPWGTPCLVPAGLDPVTDGIPSLARGDAEEDQTEVNRIHAVLHPDCYGRLVEATGLPAPDERLEVPHFFLSNGNDSQPGERRDRHPPNLNADDLAAVKDSLDELAERRKRASAGLLRIVVDGAEHARLDLKRARRIKFDLAGGAELIEIRAFDRDGDLVLASHLLSYDEREGVRPSRASIVLEGGQQLSVVVAPPSGISGALVEIRYAETNLIKAASLVTRQLLAALTPGRWSSAGARSLLPGRSGSKVPLLALTVLFIVTCVVGISIYMRRGVERPEQPAVAESKKVEPPAGTESPATEGGADSAGATERAQRPQPEDGPAPKTSAAQGARAGAAPATQTIHPSKREGPEPQHEIAAPRPAPAESQVTTPERVSAGAEMTRGMSSEAAPVSLLDARRVYVEVVGDGPVGQGVRDMLTRELQASGRFTLSNSRDEADALLKVTAQQGRAPKGGVAGRGGPAFVVQLINARGDVIWSVKGRSSRVRYQGLTAEQVGAQIAKELLEEIERLERHR